MGNNKSKTVQITTPTADKDEILEGSGKLEKIEDPDHYKPQINGEDDINNSDSVKNESTSPQETITEIEKGQPNELVAKETKVDPNPESNATDDSKTYKKDKVKKRFSFRAFSFNKKDKQIPTKNKNIEDTDTADKVKSATTKNNDVQDSSLTGTEKKENLITEVLQATIESSCKVSNANLNINDESTDKKDIVESIENNVTQPTIHMTVEEVNQSKDVQNVVVKTEEANGTEETATKIPNNPPNQVLAFAESSNAISSLKDILTTSNGIVVSASVDKTEDAMNEISEATAIKQKVIEKPNEQTIADTKQEIVGGLQDIMEKSNDSVKALQLIVSDEVERVAQYINDEKKENIQEVLEKGKSTIEKTIETVEVIKLDTITQVESLKQETLEEVQQIKEITDNIQGIKQDIFDKVASAEYENGEIIKTATEDKLESVEIIDTTKSSEVNVLLSNEPLTMENSTQKNNIIDFFDKQLIAEVVQEALVTDDVENIIEITKNTVTQILEEASDEVEKVISNKEEHKSNQNDLPPVLTEDLIDVSSTLDELLPSAVTSCLPDNKNGLASHLSNSPVHQSEDLILESSGQVQANEYDEAITDNGIKQRNGTHDNGCDVIEPIENKAINGKEESLQTEVHTSLGSELTVTSQY